MTAQPEKAQCSVTERKDPILDTGVVAQHVKSQLGTPASSPGYFASNSSFLLMYLRRQQVTAEVLQSLQPTQETQTHLRQHWCCEHLGNEAADG